MAVQIKDADSQMVGVLGAANMEQRFTTPELLENVAFSFSMLCLNAKTFATIREMGEKDILTGLLNRNSFEKSLEKYQYSDKDALACIYVDVNGLHELNNMRGHKAGDDMLRCVAGEMQSRFGAECTYRIGGDEFLVFSSGRDQGAVSELVKDLKEALDHKGYSISVGISWKHEAASIDDLVKDSERKMYAEKRDYYERCGKERKNELL